MTKNYVLLSALEEFSEMLDTANLFADDESDTKTSFLVKNFDIIPSLFQ